ncbi:MAG: TraB/GumN family protein [Candidatus Caldatribacteriota bacterium]|jgi:pheromone shutdown-related protein TraB|nr:TraB/GumN family protein [Atribacterota bacterium]MDD3030849.1 TraB/GumN family protein [Atribacterota bacterium]MDD3640240.1 TraB/GumN family protein [Atribacterota bacterium]MDD4288257.1 TraB/GumN family protein [Atribacterota bacterium]MDD4764892.1 TraB/GumN family protein [Atribacterota bacterium]
MLQNNKDIHHISLEGKDIYLIGTAHVSKTSADTVKEFIEEEKPDSVCVELCPSRFQSITNPDKWKEMDIITIIKQKKALLLLVNLILSAFQKRLARQLGIRPGQEMIQAIQSAKDNNINLVLADRDIQVTFTRIWKKLSLFGKLRLFFMLLLSIFNQEEISEEEIEKLKSEDMLTAALQDLATSFPRLKNTLIDERDQYLAEKIKNSPGSKIIAVVGAGHVPGIKKEIYNDHDLKKLTYIPKSAKWTKWLLWAIPIAIIVMIISTFRISTVSGFNQILQWLIWNGSLAALGTLIAAGHPFSILTAFFVAPISSLNPLLAAGWFAGIVEAMVRKPKVDDFEKLGDITTFGDFFRNRVTKILLIVALANLGSSLGTFVGGARVIKIFFDTIS